MKNLLLIIFFHSIFFFTIYGQNKLTIEECEDLAINNYPLIRKMDLISLTKELSLKNISKSYLPQINVNIQATYQSDVIRFPFESSAQFEDIKKDQYKISIDLNQVVWDGGKIKSHQKISIANSDVENKELEISLYKVREKIIELYFSLLAIKKQEKIIEIRHEDLSHYKQTILLNIENGTSSQTDIDRIDIEIIKLRQESIQVESIHDLYINMLSLFINKDISPKTILEKPLDISFFSNERPELMLFNSQISLINENLKLLKAKNYPTLSLFSQVGYGRPTLNILENKFKFYYYAGIGISWNIGNLYTKKNDKQILERRKNMIDIKKDVFLFHSNIEEEKEMYEINKYKRLIKENENEIDLYTRIKKVSEEKFKNGIYQLHELLSDINAESCAKQTKSLNEIQLLHHIYKLRYVKGYK